MSSYSNTNSPNFNNLLLQTLMGRLQIRPQPQISPLFNQSLEELLLDTINNLSDEDEDGLEDDDENGINSNKTELAKEELKLEKEVIRIIMSGESEERLKANTGQAVAIGEHHICVGYHVESGSEYRVWEWHGHVMLFDEENGYSPEYIYGNYFERLRVGSGGSVGKIGKVGKVKDVEVKKEVEEEKVVNSGLKELIGVCEESESGSGRILHRNMNAGSSRV